MPFFNNLPVNVELEECERGENEAALTDLFLVDVFRGVHRIMAVRVLQIGLQAHMPDIHLEKIWYILQMLHSPECKDTSPRLRT